MDQEAYAKYNKPEDGAKPGVYKHKDTNEELWAETFPAADAFVRQGWVYDRPLPSAEERAKAAAGVAAVVEAKAQEPKADDNKK